MTDPEALRRSAVADVIRRERLVAVLRRIAPQDRLVALVEELADAGVRVFEVTFDAPTAAADLRACRAAIRAGSDDALVGAGTIRSVDTLAAAVDAGADFGVSPLLEPSVLEAALTRGLPFVPGALSPTEIDAAWRAGATFVKLFPASSLGPGHVRELRGPMPAVELIPTGGLDGTTAGAFLAAGAVAVGIGGALVGASAAERAGIVAAVRAAPPVLPARPVIPERPVP
ncbi:MAG TPA: bifunctional 4-hydroxy-2-oxoglutarate aldolase/2-dehydro-3-deoxy-phosphogluconate aldolase [Candidatus Limnocylindrales bacterium]|nr:bifunctional 4-hydroxy-2-oxoglutarate aldolase/2-dehydro-3-deoxy-phosphogluconate aldolase [Candidatus Limnocylindrales bacterium]